MKALSRIEKKIIKSGFHKIAGLDEVGRGSLAGPVVAAAVLIKDHQIKFSFEIKDSKKMSEKKREEVYKTITKDSRIEWGIGKVSEKVIDKINILEASKIAMNKALDNLIKKNGIKIDYLLIDGNFRIDKDVEQRSIIKGDEKTLSCMLASIIAKVHRDDIMKRLSNNYPEYYFSRNKGYGTLTHRKLIKRKGLSKIHRRSFKLK